MVTPTASPLPDNIPPNAGNTAYGHDSESPFTSSGSSALAAQVVTADVTLPVPEPSEQGASLALSDVSVAETDETLLQLLNRLYSKISSLEQQVDNLEEKLHQQAAASYVPPHTHSDNTLESDGEKDDASSEQSRTSSVTMNDDDSIFVNFDDEHSTEEEQSQSAEMVKQKCDTETQTDAPSECIDASTQTDEPTSSSVTTLNIFPSKVDTTDISKQTGEDGLNKIEPEKQRKSTEMVKQNCDTHTHTQTEAPLASKDAAAQMDELASSSVTALNLSQSKADTSDRVIQAGEDGSGKVEREKPRKKKNGRWSHVQPKVNTNLRPKGEAKSEPKGRPKAESKVRTKR